LDRFVQEVFEPQNLNRYSYVLYNPQNYIDPSGYFHQVKKPSIFGRIFGYVVGTIVSIVTWNPVIEGLVGGFLTAALNINYSILRHRVSQCQ
jgi:hypothetical protein